MLQPGASLIHLILLVIKKTSFLYKESCSIDVFMLDSRRGTIWNSCIAPCNSESGGDVHRAKSKPCRHAAPCLQVLNRVLSISLVKIWAWRRGSRGNPRYCFFEFQGWWNDHYNLTDHMFSKSILIYIYIYIHTHIYLYIYTNKYVLPLHMFTDMQVFLLSLLSPKTKRREFSFEWSKCWGFCLAKERFQEVFGISEKEQIGDLWLSGLSWFRNF